MIIQFVTLIVLAASVIYILFHTPLFRKVPLVYLVIGTFITSIVLTPILYQFTIVTLVVDICLLTYIVHIHQTRKTHYVKKGGAVSTIFMRIKHAARNLSLPFYYYPAIVFLFFLLLSLAYITSDWLLDIYRMQSTIFSGTDVVLPSAKSKIDSYPLVILWVLVIAAGTFLIQKIIRTN